LAVCTVDHRDIYLGRYGTEESKARYDQLLAEWLSNNRRLPARPGKLEDGLSVTELCDKYWQHVETYYRRPDGSPSGEQNSMKYSLRALRYLYGDMPARSFGAAELKAVRQLFIDGYTHPRYGEQRAICRNQINARIKRVRRAIRWAVGEKLIPSGWIDGEGRIVSILDELRAVEPLKLGRSKAKESAPVLPVARAVVEATLPSLRPMLADMVRLQLESGMRPGELVQIRPIDIDMTGTGEVWLYVPNRHKTQHHGHTRCIALGPKCKEIIRRHLTTNVEEFLFSPRRLMEERAATLRAKRKSKVQPSQQNRKKAKPQKQPGDRYTTLSYGRSLSEAIKRYNQGKPESERLPHWHLHQLRHLKAQELKREFGLDQARACLGHHSPAITEHYATLDTAKAAEVMAKIG
jgi:integrase